jgi:hypothetical protein
MHWTVLEFYGSSGVVNVAHVGIPEDSGGTLSASVEADFLNHYGR